MLERRMMRRFVPLALAFCPGAPLLAQNAAAPAQATATVDKAIDNNVGPHEQFKAMMAALQKNVQEHNAAGVADLVHFPLHTSIGRIATRAAFLQNYDRIVTLPIVQVIEKQKYEDVFAGSSGAMFGNGQVWIAGICKQTDCKGTVDIRVITIQSTANLGK